MRETIALWHLSRRAMSCAKAVSAVSEKDCCVWKFVSLGIVSPKVASSWEGVAGGTSESAISINPLPGWKYL